MPRRRPARGENALTTRWQTSTGWVELVPDRHDPDRSVLHVNGVPSSPVHSDPTVLDFEYLQWMAEAVELLAVPAPPAPLRVLHLGGGACALARHLEAVRPGSRQVVVELDTELARQVRRWVPVPRAPLVRVQAGDARERLAGRPSRSADVVVRDVFAGDATPRHVCTTEFLAEVARVLVPGGLYLANVVDRTGAPAGAPLAAEAATALAAFPHAALAGEPAVLRGRRYGNVVVVARTAPGSAPPGNARPGRAELDGAGAAALERRLRGGAAPAHLVTGERLAAMAARGLVLRDPGPPVSDL